MPAKRSRPQRALLSPWASPLSWSARALVSLSLAGLCAQGLAQADPSPLPALGLDARSVTVSGLSSGGYMAAQFEVAFSRSVAGAAIVAGGPYGCSLGSVTTAALTCSCPYDGANPASTELTRLQCLHLPAKVLSGRARQAIEGNKDHIDGISNLRKHRLWLYSGDADPVVDTTIVDGLQQFYKDAKVAANRIRRVKEPTAGHGMPIDTQGSCALTESPYINGCKLDGAGELLKWLYKQPNWQAGRAQAGSLKPFDQKPYRQAGVFDSLDDSGWLYVPQACEQSGARCKLHVAFHGCEQGQNFPAKGQPYGTTFVTHAGYNRWAEAAGIVVLYPQVVPSNKFNMGSPYEFNPKGCWDFWGYTSPLGDASLFGTAPPFARQDAPQLRAVKAMVDALLAQP